MKTATKALLVATVLFSAAALAQQPRWQERGDAAAARTDAADDDAREGRRDQGHRDAVPRDQGRRDAVPRDDIRRDDVRRDQGRRDDVRRADRGAVAVRRDRDSSRDIARGRPERRDDRDDAQRDGHRFGFRVDDRGTWNRGWRGDHRYDYDRYRTSNRGAYRLPRYYAPPDWGYGYRRFSIGVTLSAILWDQDYWIDDPYVYRLPEAYGPYRWVRYYDDALLIDIRTGRIVDTVYGIFD